MLNDVNQESATHQTTSRIEELSDGQAVYSQYFWCYLSMIVIMWQTS